MRYFPLACATFAILAVVSIGCSDSAPTDKVISVDDEDAEMQAAIATARAKLPEFWQVFEERANDESGFALKVHITDSNGDEHFWVTDLEKEDDKVYGSINNDPNIVKSVKLGQRIEVPNDKISDWLFMRNGKMVGNYTLRPLMKEMSPEEVAKVKSMMAEP